MAKILLLIQTILILMKMMLDVRLGARDIIDVISADNRIRGKVQITPIVKGVVGSVKSFGDFVQGMELSKETG
ncbi:MAG: hypothetical protein CM1200mP37_3530 [Chloroflexota bacterium]|nr:MAG: hypothetical protein CM1200mP37_3530 [Chloroflexota bacterium]